MSKFIPIGYQELMINWLRNRREAALFCSPGLGKTPCTLKAWDKLSFDGATRGMLIVAPKRVCTLTWPKEVRKWGFSKWMTIANLRTAEGIRHWEKGTADIYVINSEMLATREVRKKCPGCQDGRRFTLWDDLDEKDFLADDLNDATRLALLHNPRFREQGMKLKHHKREDCEVCWGEGSLKISYPGFVAKHIKGRKKKDMPVDTLVIDELSLAKSPTSKRFNALRAWRGHFDRIWGLTGTPAPNSYIDLWAQIRFLDDGARFGLTQNGYRSKYFATIGDGPFKKFIPVKGGKEAIEKKLSNLALTMLSDDYLDVPTCNYEDIEIELPAKGRKEYNLMKKELLLELEEGTIEALNAAALTNKLLQITGGAVYDADKTVHEIHGAKIDALKKIVKKHKGEPILILTQFKHERDRILKALPNARMFHERDMGAWQRGEIPVWVADPRSMSHGIDGIQDGGHIAVWFTLTYSNETYIQTNARIVRTGQSSESIVYRIIAADTVDEAVAEALRDKEDQQQGLFTALKMLQEMERENKKKKAA